MRRSAVFFPTPGARATDAGHRDEQLEQRKLVAGLEAEQLLRVVADDVMRVQRHRVSGRLSRDEHLVADAANIDHDMIRAARDNLAADVRDHKTLSRVGAGDGASRVLASDSRGALPQEDGADRAWAGIRMERARTPSPGRTRTHAWRGLTSRSRLRRRTSRAARGSMRSRWRRPRCLG